MFLHDQTFDRVIVAQALCEIFRFTVGLETFVDDDDENESEALVTKDAFEKHYAQLSSSGIASVCKCPGHRK